MNELMNEYTNELMQYSCQFELIKKNIIIGILADLFSLLFLFRAKRTKPMDDGLWDCSVCTYKNSAEAFKCAMCDVRKGTSTR